jgi:hypothetical protein
MCAVCGKACCVWSPPLDKLTRGLQKCSVGIPTHNHHPLYFAESLLARLAKNSSLLFRAKSVRLWESAGSDMLLQICDCCSLVCLGKVFSVSLWKTRRRLLQQFQVPSTPRTGLASYPVLLPGGLVHTEVRPSMKLQPRGVKQVALTKSYPFFGRIIA